MTKVSVRTFTQANITQNNRTAIYKRFLSHALLCCANSKNSTVQAKRHEENGFRIVQRICSTIAFLIFMLRKQVLATPYFVFFNKNGRKLAIAYNCLVLQLIPVSPTCIHADVCRYI